MRPLFLTTCAVFCLTIAVPVVAGKAIEIQPTSMRVIQAECVIVGKITSVEKLTIKASASPGDTSQTEYQVAVVKVEESLLGAKNVTHIKIGYVPAPVGTGEEAEIRGRRRYYPAVNFAVGQEVCLILRA